MLCCQLVHVNTTSLRELPPGGMTLELDEAGEPQPFQGSALAIGPASINGRMSEEWLAVAFDYEGKSLVGPTHICPAAHCVPLEETN